MEKASPLSTREADAVRDDLERLKEDLKQMREDLSSLSSDAVKAAKAGASQAKDTIHDGVRAAAAKGRESVEMMEDQISTHPLMAVGAAFALGMVLGVSMSRRG